MKTHEKLQNLFEAVGFSVDESISQTKAIVDMFKNADLPIDINDDKLPFTNFEKVDKIDQVRVMDTKRKKPVVMGFARALRKILDRGTDEMKKKILSKWKSLRDGADDKAISKIFKDAGIPWEGRNIRYQNLVKTNKDTISGTDTGPRNDIPFEKKIEPFVAGVIEGWIQQEIKKVEKRWQVIKFEENVTPQPWDNCTFEIWSNVPAVYNKSNLEQSGDMIAKAGGDEMLLGSCMNDREGPKFYGKYKNKVKALVMLSENKKIVARALLWTDVLIDGKTKTEFVDRVYAIGRLFEEKFKEYVREKGYLHRTITSLQEGNEYITNKGKKKMIIEMPGLDEHSSYPYIDTFFYALYDTEKEQFFLANRPHTEW